MVMKAQHSFARGRVEFDAGWIDLLECWHNDRWYEPPLPLDGLARAFRVSPHHSSAIRLKVNLGVACREQR